MGSGVVAPGLLVTGSMGVELHGFSCSEACGILPDQGSNPCLLHWQVNYLPLNHQGSPSLIVFCLSLSHGQIKSVRVRAIFGLSPFTQSLIPIIGN